MTRRLAAIAGALCALALTACQSLPGAGAGAAPAAADSGGRIDQVLARGELRVGLTANQPPLNVKSRSGAYMGLEVDVVNALADSMGVEVRFVETPFAELLDRLEAGDVDMVISGLTITPERNARVAFAGPYLISGKSLLTRDEKLARAEHAADLDDPKRRYAALEGSTSAQFVRDWMPSAQLRTTVDYDAAVQLVMKDEVDALIADFPICALSVLRYPNAGLWRHRNPFTIEPLGIALPADDPLFVNLVDNYLETLDDSGILTALKVKWFSTGDWIEELP